MTVTLWITTPAVMAQTATSEATSTATHPQHSALAEAPIPLEEVGTEAPSIVDTLREIDKEVNEDVVIKTIKEELSMFVQELNPRLEEATKLVQSNSSLDELRRLEQNLIRQTQALDVWNAHLARRAAQLDKRFDQLSHLEKVWELTLNTAQDPGIPTVVVNNIQSSIDAIRQSRNVVEARQKDVLSLQNRIAQSDRRLDSILDTIGQARGRLIERLLKRDSPSLLNSEFWDEGRAKSVAEVKVSIFNQINHARAFIKRQNGKLFIQGIVTILLVLFAVWSVGRIYSLLTDEADLQGALPILNSPIGLGVLLSILMSAWMFPAQPRLWTAAFGAAALVPLAIILFRLCTNLYWTLLIPILMFHFMDLLRSILAVSPFFCRLLLLMELGIAMILLVWACFCLKVTAANERNAKRPKRFQTIILFLMSVTALAFIAVIAGDVNLGTLIANGIFSGSYFTVLLFVSYRVLELLLMCALLAPPLNLLGTVKKYRHMIWRRSMNLVKGALIALCIWFLLERWALREPLWQGATTVLTAPLSLGSLTLTLGHILAFGFTVWAAFLVSRFIRFILEEDVYSHVQLAPGLPYAISSTLHYAILLSGFLFAINVLGFDMTKFTILVSAFGVGLGFGLQNILNNFVSGIILLFERPIRVGDVIQMDDVTGTIEHIGIRATTLKTTSGSQVILPNGKFISDRVINWTFGNHRRILEIPVSVAPSADPKHVIDVLKQVAAADTRIEKDPPPEAMAVKLNTGSFDFELRVTTTHINELPLIRSDLAMAINKALA